MSDVVSGLLAKLSELEATAREAARYSSESWESPCSAVVDLGSGDRDALIPVPASPIAHLVADHDPRSVLRLCRAHRDLIDAYEKQKAICDAYLAFPAAEHSEGHAAAIGGKLGLMAAINLVARGLGVEETEDR